MFDEKELEVDAKSKDYDLDRFCLEVKEGIEFYGFPPFFYGPSLADPGRMAHYVEDRHLVSLASVLHGHAPRLVTPAEVLDPATGIETPASFFACHKCYISMSVALWCLQDCTSVPAEQYILRSRSSQAPHHGTQLQMRAWTGIVYNGVGCVSR
jgi:hypothetical protein